MGASRDDTLAAFFVALAWFVLGAGAAEAQFCRVEVAGSVGFGDYDPLASGNLDGNGQVRFRCPAAVPIARVKITAGSGGSFSPRTMAGGVDQLAYNLYLDPSRSVVWGDGSGGSSFLTAAPPPVNDWESHTVYARTPLGQDVSAGPYDDTVVVVMEW